MTISTTVRSMMAVGMAFGAIGLVGAPVATADPDTNFASELRGYGIYGPRDYNAWIGKITCKRLFEGIDGDANASARFVQAQLPRSSNSTEQAWQFLAAAYRYYCPDKVVLLEQAARPAPSAE